MDEGSFKKNFQIVILLYDTVISSSLLRYNGAHVNIAAFMDNCIIYTYILQSTKKWLINNTSGEEFVLCEKMREYTFQALANVWPTHPQQSHLTSHLFIISFNTGYNKNNMLVTLFKNLSLFPYEQILIHQKRKFYWIQPNE